MSTDDPLAQLVLAFLKLAALLPLLAAYIIVVIAVRVGTWVMRRGSRLAEGAERQVELQRVLRETEAARRRLARIVAAGEREIRGVVRSRERKDRRR